VTVSKHLQTYRHSALFGTLLGLWVCLSHNVWAADKSPDLILYNGQLFTSDDAHPHAEAIAIRGDRITAIGTSAIVRAGAGAKTRLLDLGGRVVIPGINDAHNHISVDPPRTEKLIFAGDDPNLADIRQAIEVAVGKYPKGTWLTGDIALAAYFDPGLDRIVLDAVAPNHPVILNSITGHVSILNSVALTRLGVAEDIKDPVAGRFERNPDGRLTGRVREYANLAITRRLTALTPEDAAVAQLKKFYASAAKWGITSIQDMSDSFIPERAAELFQKASVPIRIRIITMAGTTPTGRDDLEGATSLRASPLITASGIKWMLDGTPLEGTLTPPLEWQDLLKAGIDQAWAQLPLSFPQSELPKILETANRRHQQLMVHVSGYPSALAILDAIEAQGAVAWRAKRIRFEHGDGLFPDLVPRAKELGIIVVQNPSHFAIGLHPTQAFPLKSLWQAGIPVALGSDGPTNPFLNIMFASTHPARPSEAISREQAVVAYTRNAAYAEFAEKEKGTLTVGKLADLAVLSKDLFNMPAAELPSTESELTLVGGKIIYSSGVVH
jgi:predicted amidohydrolase YtcJ